jgi:UDP-N-acetylmuramoyl-tripeptide--D-alanyl-D-alanine ligase
VAVLTNALPAHLQGFGSLQAVAATKGEIYDALGPDGVAVLNVDEPFADAWLARIGVRTVLRASARGAVTADVRAEDVTMHEGNASFRLVSAAGAVRIALGVPGVQQVANAVCAAAAAVALGLGLDAIRDGLESLAPVSGRMQRRVGARGCVLIDDSYNANPGSVRAAIDSLATFSGTRVLALGNMAELGEQSRELHREVGAHARARGIDRLLACGPHADAVAEGFGPGASALGSREAVAAACREFDRAGSVILVKGSRSAGMEAVVAALVEAESGAAGTGRH